VKSLNVRKIFSRFFDPSDLRERQILSHIIYSAGLKVVNVFVSLVVIPLYLEVLTDITFGIWLTVSAVINWFNFFDLGMGNGLRNRFAEAKAQGNSTLAKKYVSTAYSLLTIISLSLLLIFIVANLFVDWHMLFGSPNQYAGSVDQMVVILAVLFCPQFVVQLIKMILIADQRPALSNLLNTLVNILQLAALYFLSFQHSVELPLLAAVMGGINLSIPLLASIFFFSRDYKIYRPRLQLIDFSLSRDLLGLSFVFFVMQGAALVVFMTDNLIISNVLGPDHVPAYNISYRYFNLAVVFFGLITTPFWSAFTEAFVKNDTQWIRRMINRLLIIWLMFTILAVCMYFLAPWVYSTWLNDKLYIPNVLNFFMMLWVVFSTLLSIYGTFLSGVGKLRLSLFHAIFVMILNIPLSIYLAGFEELGSAGVILASLICTLFRILYQPLQTYKILSGKARGIWSR